MADINTQKFCDKLAERPGWDAPKVSRLQLFLRKEEAWGDGVSLETFTRAIARFVQSEGDLERGTPPPDAPLTDTS